MHPMASARLRPGAAVVALLLWSALAGPRSAGAQAACEQVRVFESGRAGEQLCSESARARGLAVVDLGDGWLPRVLREPPDAPPELQQPYRGTYLALADERPEDLPNDQRFETHLELFGIVPTLRVVRGRMLDTERHRCDAAVDNGQLAALDRNLSPWQPDLATQRRRVERLRQDRRWLERALERLGLHEFTEIEGQAAYAFTLRRYRRDLAVAGAIEAVQDHLACAGLLGRHEPGVFDAATTQALRLWQRGHMLVAFGALDAPTRALMVQGSREMVFRTALRVLRERVVDALALIEDGSATGHFGRVLGRVLDPPDLEVMGYRERLAGGAEDLVSPATEAAARALGWNDPQGLERFLQTHDAAATAELRVALRLPPAPAYHGPRMQLHAEIDRGDVYYGYPYTRAGRPRRQPVKRRPTLILIAEVDGVRKPLLGWNTTIGGFQPEQAPGGVLGLRYKPSPVGPRVWRDLLATPAWLPPPTTPDRELVQRGAGGGYEPRRELVGPGYRSAYGLAMLVHLKPRAVRATRWASAAPAGDIAPPVDGVDQGVRTHGSVSYGSILHGYSHGCHRLFNHLALRLAGFLLAHRDHVRHGNLAVQYSRALRAHGTHVLRATTRGYRYELVPPVPVDVLEGNILGLPRKPITGLRPLPEQLVEAVRRAAEGGVGPTSEGPPSVD